MSLSTIDSIKIKAKLLQKAKRKSGQNIKLTEALEILAKTSGFESWREWREILLDHEAFLSPVSSSHWHVWYSSYEQACADLAKKSGGYLIPYQKHFFICDDDYLRSLGIDSSDPDLKQTGNNWVEPKDSKAFERLREKILKNRR